MSSTSSVTVFSLLLLLQTTSRTVGQEDATNTSWYCDYPVEDVPTQKELLASLKDEYSKNSSSSFYPEIGFFREKYQHVSSCTNRDHLMLSIYDIEEQGIPKAPMPRLWPSREIPFAIDENYPAETQKRIRSDMQAFSDATCLIFKERTVERGYIHFVHPNNIGLLAGWPVDAGNGGMVAPSDPDGVPGGVEGKDPGYTGTAQFFIRSDADIVSRGSGVMQTLMFVLGFKREELRHDRDEYISLTFSGDDKKRNMYQKEMVAEFDLIWPYDTQSAAHMTFKDAQDLNVGLESMDDDAFPIKASVDSVLSLGDISKINILYCENYFKTSTESTKEAYPQDVTTHGTDTQDPLSSSKEAPEIPVTEPSQVSGGVGKVETGGSGDDVPEYGEEQDEGSFDEDSGGTRTTAPAEERSEDMEEVAVLGGGGDVRTTTGGTTGPVLMKMPTAPGQGYISSTATTRDLTTSAALVTTSTGSTTTEGIFLDTSSSSRARVTDLLSFVALLGLVWRTIDQDRIN